MTTNDPTRDVAIRDIARRETPFPTLERRRTGEDFREIAVWTLEQALVAAYEAGRAAAAVSRVPSRIDCPSCKRQIRIGPIA